MFTTFKQAVKRVITCDYLAEALREHSQALKEHSAALLTKTSTVDPIEKHAKYLATAEQQRLKREGRPYVFEN